MTAEIPALVDAAWPFVTAAVGAYGAAVLSQGQDRAADATVSLGQRLLQRIFHADGADLGNSLGSADGQSELRASMTRILELDSDLAREITRMIAESTSVDRSAGIISYASGNAQVANMHTGTQNVSFGGRSE
ncbi:hypothetical protein [Nocardia sp. NPDC058497]|uniref:hypothetical protein n=1 Tax=Nocardia sp. NPDC058497 TaxID=3346529 RepID=UPI00366066A6